MRNRPRRAFAAPFILTIAAALPGCTKAGPNTRTTEHTNPPNVTSTAAPYQSWTVQQLAPGQCDAYGDIDCPPPDEATCNPPPPMKVACPGSLAEDAQLRIVQLEQDGPCYLEAMTCPDGGCDREPTACPSWDDGDAE